MVRINDNDNDANDLLDRVYANEAIPLNDTFTEPQDYTGRYNVITLRMSFKAVCSPNYYGSDCRVFCRPTDDATGHYSCDEDGNKVCLPGWVQDATNNCLTGRIPFSTCVCSLQDRL